MTNEEAIKHIRTWIYATTDVPPLQVAEAMDIAINALRAVDVEYRRYECCDCW